MVRIRDVLAISSVLLMLFSSVPLTFCEVSDAASEGNDCILLYELDPKDATEGIAVMNYGSSTVDLSGYTVKNSSAKELSLSGSISPGNVAVFVREIVDDDWFCEDTSTRTVTVCSDSKVSLKNTGDAVYLYDEKGELVDTVCYKDYTASEGWSGIPVDLGYKEHVIRRVEIKDTDTYFDWAAVGDGYTAYSFGDTKVCVSSVVPFTFPESGGKPILQSLMGATESVRISMYMLTSGYIVSVLSDLSQNKGVSVEIILENKPLGYTQDGELLKAAVDSGAEIKFIGGGSYDRYSYVHNKYAIIDGDEVIITSENWTAGNISTDKGNRGWGAIVYGTEFASQMNAFFENDWNFSDDFISFDEKFPSVTAKTLPSISTVSSYVDSVEYTTNIYSNVKASIYMSPDNTFKALQYLIDNAKTRVYTQQMDVGSSYETFETTSPLSAMIKAADRGVDSRFLTAGSDNQEFVDRVCSETKIKAGIMSSSGYVTMHNKGVIIDDTVWVSSVNWTENAFMNNRECGLYLQSAELTQFYVDAYMKDWDAADIGENKGSSESDKDSSDTDKDSSDNGNGSSDTDKASSSTEDVGKYAPYAGIGAAALVILLLILRRLGGKH